MKKLIYEDDNIIAYFKDGTSDYLLITFQDLMGVGKDSFFAESPCIKKNITCIGVIAKKANWYPGRSMFFLKKKLSVLLAKFKIIVIYGGSMGGYAALKYSNLLEATNVIALCPQWSINPDECHGLQGSWGGYYTPDMGVMGVNKSDVSGDIYVFSDPYDKVDNFHLKKIQENVDIKHIRFNSVGHHVTSVLAGSDNLIYLLNSCIKGAFYELNEFISTIRKKHPARVSIILKRVVLKHPSLTARLLINDKEKESKLSSAALDLFPKVIERLLKNDSDIYPFYQSFFPLIKPFYQKFLYINILANTKAKAPAVFTYHGTFLVLDLIDGLCKAINSAEYFYFNNKYVILKINFSNNELFFYIDTALGKGTLSISEKNRCLSIFYSLSHKETWFQIKELNSGSFLLKNNDFYLCVSPTGNLTCDRSQASNHEKFNLWVV